ncbi:MAG: hypothetical protein U0Q19_22325 [Kineosporiaceae bacterium]
MSVLRRPRRSTRSLIGTGLGLALALGLAAQTSLTAAAGTTRPSVVTIRTVSTTVKGAKATTLAVTYRGTDRFVKRSLETSVAALAATRLAAFNDAYSGPSPSGHAGEYQLTGKLVANAAPVLALEFAEYLDVAGAHPTNGFHAIIVNSRTGLVWSQRDLAEQLDAAAPAGVTTLAEVRKAVAAALPTEARSEASHLALDDVTLIPTSAGLRVDIDRCVLTCVLGSTETVIGWKRLLAPSEQVDFVPAIWRR